MTDEPHPRRKAVDPAAGDAAARPPQGDGPSAADGASPEVTADQVTGEQVSGEQPDAPPAGSEAVATPGGMRRGPLVGIAVAVVVLLVGLLVVTNRKSDTVVANATPTTTTTRVVTTAGTTPGTEPGSTETFPEDGSTFPTMPGFTLPPPRQPDPLPGPPFTTITPINNGQLATYNAPMQGAGIRTLLPNPRLIGNSPAAAVPLTLLVKQRVGDWFEAYLPIRPNGSTGYVKATDVKAEFHDYHIEVRLSQFNLKAYKGDRLILDAPIGVAMDNTPTPGGTYFTTELIKPTNSAYGPFAYGLSGYSEVLQTFNGGPGQIGIHGTSNERGIPGRVSHGCIRLRNADISRLAGELPLAVPVQIYP